MLQSIRAIYSEGQLHLLEPVNLSEGQEIRLMILSDEDAIRAALGDLLVEIPDTSPSDLDEAALLREVEEAFRGQPPLSEAILQERREGP
jgi:predicted DNA-binding antitoxin AbrB/MazE fold protein